LDRQNLSEREPFFSVVLIFALSVFIIFVPSPKMIVATIMLHRCSDVKGQRAVSFSQNGGIFTACIVSRAQRERVAFHFQQFPYGSERTCAPLQGSAVNHESSMPNALW
jgi:hypothetical protein